MTTAEKKYHRKIIATEQLKTAILLFLDNRDLSSVITLAGASSNILTQLARNAGEEPFIDYACRVHNHIKGYTPPREKYNHHINRILGISVHKHMSQSCPETITLDLHNCAINALIRAVGDYVTLYGQEEDFIKKFLNWTWHNNKYANKIMERFNRIPEKLIKKKK